MLAFLPPWALIECIDAWQCGPESRTCAVIGQRRGIKKGQFKLGGNGWGDAESYATASNSIAGKNGPPAGQGQSTYLDLAAATEAEALQHKRSMQRSIDLQDDPDSMSLPTSDFGIGRRA